MPGIVHVYPEVRGNDGVWYAIEQDKSITCPSCRGALRSRSCKRCGGVGGISKPFYHSSYDNSGWLVPLSSPMMVIDGLVGIEGSDRPEGSKDVTRIMDSMRPSRGWSTRGYAALPMNAVLAFDWNQEQSLSWWSTPTEYFRWRGRRVAGIPLMSAEPDPTSAWGRTYPLSEQEALDNRASLEISYYRYNDIRSSSYRVRVEDYKMTPAQSCAKFVKALPLMQAVAPADRTRLVIIAYY